ncbi:MAG: hypothetical protein HQL16_01735 [Candidatus Omnitrophica bacterium]|nr:hypothetical protein [Candidatus Omnitrophota bacterium]
MFIKELRLNIEQFEKLVEDNKFEATEKKDSTLEEFCQNLNIGINYYRSLIPQIIEETEIARERMLTELNDCAKKINSLYPAA